MIEKILTEFVRVYWGSPENPEYQSYISKENWLRTKLTLIQEEGFKRGKNVAVDYIKANSKEDLMGGVLPNGEGFEDSLGYIVSHETLKRAVEKTHVQ